MEAKKIVRKKIMNKRNALPLEYKKIYDNQICEALWKRIKEKKAEYIHCYLPIGSEINCMPLLQRLLDCNKTIICPKTLPERKLEHLKLHATTTIEQGMWGTFHPAGEHIYQGDIDFIIVPGLAFDKRRYRLGYGGGYYDAFLAKHRHAYKVAVCYPFQYLHEVPIEAHDCCMDEIIHLSETNAF